MVNITFWGVRGSTPCPCDANRRYGGNTACVSLEAPGLDPVVFDLGTGLRFYGDAVVGDEPFRGLALVTHLHWDHVQGLPFFVPIHQAGASLEICGRSGEGSLRGAFEEFMRPPFFPVRPDDLLGDIRFRDVADTSFDWGRAHVTVADVPHTGATNGYRVEVDGVVVAYVSDHQEPVAGGPIAPSVLELCRDADLVIHDAQYEADEFARKSDWGHCTVAYAVRVAAEAGAKRLALFHHDPSHGDDVVDRLRVEAEALAIGTSIVEVVAAAEGLTVALEAAPAELRAATG
ncbi:MAG TPA: MBL fold metallo-hydrolase [Aquihabitans sp.]|jgi:phosphoribosyl 1,2-cyclic phosphodiesterase|nr:MBL fold metallo-hydrolase [Aquihabitans sp.]